MTIFYICSGTVRWGYDAFNKKLFTLSSFEINMAVYQQIAPVTKPWPDLPPCEEIYMFQIDKGTRSMAIINENTTISGEGEDLVYHDATNVQTHCSRQEIHNKIKEIYAKHDAEDVIDLVFQNALCVSMIETPETLIYRVQELLQIPCTWKSDEETLDVLHKLAKLCNSVKLNEEKIDKPGGFIP